MEHLRERSRFLLLRLEGVARTHGKLLSVLASDLKHFSKELNSPDQASAIALHLDRWLSSISCGGKGVVSDPCG